MTNEEIVARALCQSDADAAGDKPCAIVGQHYCGCIQRARAVLAALSSAGRLVGPMRRVERAQLVIEDDAPDEGADIRFPAPDATVKCNKCDGAGWVWSHELGLPRSDDTRYACDVCEGRGKLPTTIDATDWKARCEAAEAEFATVFERVNREIPDEFALDPPDGGDVKIWEAVGRMREALTAAQAENEKLRAELAEYERLFDLRWAADMRGVGMWRKEAPGRDLTFPDRADLVLYLLQKPDEKP